MSNARDTSETRHTRVAGQSPATTPPNPDSNHTHMDAPTRAPTHTRLRTHAHSIITLQPLRTWWRDRSLVDVHGWRVSVLAKLPDSSVAMSPPMLEAIAALKLPWKVRDPASGIVFLLCPPGKCTIGSSSDEEGHKDDETLIACNIKHPFYLAETTTTQEHWERITGANPSVHVGPKLPVENVSVNDCIAFTRACGPGFRFPHEVEWEYACRAGSDTPFSHATFLDADIVNYNGRYPYRDGPPGPDRRQTVAAGSMPANAWGFHEMHGNVWEWCVAAATRVSLASADSDANVPAVMRGGSWANHAHNCRSASRITRASDYSRKTAGFRMARGL
jgi:formylglycine-generating enzyme required for sulfatase activity